MHITTTQLQTIGKQILVMLLFVAIGLMIALRWQNMVWLALGGVIGVGVWWLDELVGLAYYRRDEYDTELITRSPLFALVFAIVALFVVTSTDQHIGFGVIWGISAGLLVEVWQFVRTPELFTERFFGMLKRAQASALNQVQTLQVATGVTAYIVLLVCLWVLRLT